MKTIAREAEERQTLLGEHQDAEALIEARNLAATETGRAFTYGVLMANDLHRAAEIRASLKK
jgi:hypothetical protein